MTSSVRNAVPLVSTAPTVMTEGSLAGERTPPVLHRPLVLAADVAGRGHDDEATLTAFCTARFSGSAAVGLDDRVADREVDDADAVFAAMLDDPFDRRDDVAGLADAAVVQHLERDDARAGRNTGVLPLRRAAVAGHHAGDVRAVPVAVVNALAGEIEPRRNARLEVGMQRHARVDHGDANAAASESPHVAIGGPDLVRTNRGRDRIGGAMDLEVERQALDPGLRGELLDFGPNRLRSPQSARSPAGGSCPEDARLRCRHRSRARRDDDREAPCPGGLFPQRRRDVACAAGRRRASSRANERKRSSVRTPPRV